MSKKLRLHSPLGTYWEIECLIAIVKDCHEFDKRVYEAMQTTWLADSFNLRISPHSVEINQYGGGPGRDYDSTWCRTVFGSTTKGGLRAGQTEIVYFDEKPLIKVKRKV
ncbi:hypothetical protein [Shimazuella alba]|uniref:Uncharacterized protein n=1 Tax=Shimazuella alba TaxID=2690964 RepID=A0A6I4VWV4_9BACL|nr:hypothetical protein [Shimazuella alba]MXQ52492.1 hypothetical protein [Shimazuella alba]